MNKILNKRIDSLTEVALALLLAASMVVSPSFAGEVSTIRYSIASDHARLVFGLSSPARYLLQRLRDPDRLVIDLANTQEGRAIKQPDAAHPLIKRVRTGLQKKRNLRIVLDLKADVRPKVFKLKPAKGYGHRLVVDLYNQDVLSQKTAKAKPRANVKAKVKTKVRRKPSSARDIIIAIDAGHGGKDPGARGARGTREKDVVFAIAKKLAVLIEKEPGMRPVLTRKGDYFMSLRDRIKKARQAKADLFLSIHADAFRNPKVEGSSIFTLSPRGATSEASRWLATNENSVDLIGGVSLHDKEDGLASVLLDLSQKATQEASYNAANAVFGKMKRLGKTHGNQVQRAGFVVLKSPDIPSILVETAFISNPKEERKLRTPKHQVRFAKAIFSGVKNYFSSNPPPGTLLAIRKHKIIRGDTLSGIAQHYGVSTKQLLTFNSLRSSRIRVGQVLDIPAGS